MKGSCLCQAVTFNVEPPFKLFQYCHCSRCQKVTGSAHASNLFINPDQLTWTKGADNVGRFEKPDAKYFATGFCKTCGSCLPWQAKGAANMVVPAGSLDEAPPIAPKHNIYWASRAAWYIDPATLCQHDALPPKK